MHVYNYYNLNCKTAVHLVVQVIQPEDQLRVYFKLIKLTCTYFDERIIHRAKDYNYNTEGNLNEKSVRVKSHWPVCLSVRWPSRGRAQMINDCF